MKSSGNLLFTQMGLSVFLPASPDITTSITSVPWRAIIPIAIIMITARPTFYTCNMQHRSTGKCNVHFTAIGLNNKSIFHEVLPYSYRWKSI